MRIRQIIAAISCRLIDDAWLREQQMIWHARTVCQYVAAAAPFASGDNPLLAEAARIGRPEQPTTQPAAGAARGAGGVDAPAGSFERFMAAFVLAKGGLQRGR